MLRGTRPHTTNTAHKSDVKSMKQTFIMRLETQVFSWHRKSKLFSNMLTSGTKSSIINKKQPSPAVPQRKSAHQPKAQAIENRCYRARASRATHHPFASSKWGHRFAMVPVTIIKKRLGFPYYDDELIACGAHPCRRATLPLYRWTMKCMSQLEWTPG